MKVLVIGHSFVVSTNRMLWNELGAKTEMEVDIVVPKSWKSNLIKNLDFHFDKNTDSGFTKVYPLKVYGKGNASFFIFSPFQLWKVLNQKSYDAIILAQETWSFSLAELNILKFLSNSKKAKLYIWICQNLKKTQLFWLRYFEKLNTSGVDTIYGCCNETEDVLRWKGIENRWKKLPFSYDSKQYQYQQKNPNQRFTLGYLGRISEEKGIIDLLSTYDHLKTRFPNIELVIGGAGPLEREIEKRDGVRYLGVLSHNEAHKFYEEIDLFVLPSLTRPFWKEQFGRVIIESVASGVPVVGSSSGAIPEVLSSLELPYCFKEGDRVDLEEKILKVWEDYQSGALSHIMEKARELVDQKYKHESVSQFVQMELEAQVRKT